MKIGENRIVDERCMRIILNNTRLPDNMENDLFAQVASVAAAAEDMKAMFDRYGRETLFHCFEALINYSEQRTRAEISQIPDGVYEHEELILDDGAKGGPYKLKLAIHKTGSDILFDFTGTDPQIRGPINAPLATTWAAIFYAMRCVTDPSIPSTEGNKRPFKVIAPEGTLVNAKKPAAVYQRMVVCHSLVDLVMGALSQIVPERVMGDSCGCLYNFTSARERDTGNPSVFGEVVPGGLGATSKADGIDVMSCHVTNCPIRRSKRPKPNARFFMSSASFNPEPVAPASGAAASVRSWPIRCWATSRNSSTLPRNPSPSRRVWPAVCRVAAGVG